MKNLNRQRFVWVGFVAFAFCFAALALVNGSSITDLYTVLRIAYKTIPAILLMCGIFVTWGWKWRIFRGWLVPFPDLNGLWRGTLQTTWVDPATLRIPSPIDVTLAIKQSFVRISCVMRTDQMNSRSFLADFWLDGDEQIRKLGYCYFSTPRQSVREQSAPHQGTVIFEIVGSPPSRLRGEYWTDRKTTGEVELVFERPGVLDERKRN